jgi:hypothetical protein
VVLTGNVTVSAGAGNITFDSTVNADATMNNRTLTLNSTGTTTLGGAVGNLAGQTLGSLTTIVVVYGHRWGWGHHHGNQSTRCGGAGADTTFTTTNAAIGFGSTFDGGVMMW